MGYKSYTAEYKTKVVLEVLREEKPLGEIASSDGLNPNMVRNWKADFLAKASSVFKNPEKAAKKAKRQKGGSPGEKKCANAQDDWSVDAGARFSPGVLSAEWEARPPA